MSTSCVAEPCAFPAAQRPSTIPLFYREGHRMCPSVYASQLRPLSLPALKFLNQEPMPPAAFVPAASTDCMQIAITDFTAFCVFPTLMHHLQREAPGLRFELRYLAPQPGADRAVGGRGRPALGFNTLPGRASSILILRRLTGCGRICGHQPGQPDGADPGRLPCCPSSGGDPVE